MQDPSNGGTRPQGYVNISSSCPDRSQPSVYYSLVSPDINDPSQDVIMFRWRVEQIAHNYATGPNPGTFGASHPWTSALWTVLFDLDGSGYRSLAAHLNGSSGRPGEPIDMLAGVYGRIPTQSINYEDDPDNIKLLGHNPTAFIDSGTDGILNFQNSLDPVSSWPNGSSEVLWDYGTTRAMEVSERPCVEYFIDYQIPVALLDAEAFGGPKIERNTPISMLFCTANSLNNPFQKDCALNREWVADPSKPAPFGDYIAFDQDEPFAQPIIRELTAEAPGTCSDAYELEATVQDTLWVTENGEIEPSVHEVSFWYYHDVNGDGIANDGSAWTFATNATPVPGALNKWRASWDSSNLPKGRYLIGVQAVDDNTLVDDDMSPTGVDNRTFSYVTSDSLGRVYIDSDWIIPPGDFPSHSPAISPSASENWYGNPLITGEVIATTGVDLAVNTCGVAPEIAKDVTPGNVAVGDIVSYTISIDNPANNASITVDSVTDVLPDGFSFIATTGGTLSDFASEPSKEATGTLTWELAAPVTVNPGASATLVFVANAALDAGTYNNIASASTSFGVIESDPVAVNVDAARLSLTKTPDQYLISPDGTTELTYTLAWANDSSVSLTNASIDDVLPSGVTYVGCTGGSSCAESAGTVTWQLGTLAGGASGSVTLTVTVDSDYASTSLTNTATFTATAPDGTQISRDSGTRIAVDVPAAALPAFTLNKSADQVRVDPGDQVVWQLAYSNFGDGPAASVLLSDDLPAGFGSITCDASGSGHFSGCTVDSGTVIFHDGGGDGVSIPAGAGGTVTVTGTAAAAPFTFPNPAVNVATLQWPDGSKTASSSVGVGGDYCDAVYYFQQGGQAGLEPPTGTTEVTIGPADNTSFSFTTLAPDEGLNVAGTELTIAFYLSSGTGNAIFDVTLENVTQGQTIASGSETFGQTGGVATFRTVTANVTDNIDPDDQLRWTFTLNFSGQQAFFYYDSVQHNSRSSFCVANAPPNLTLSKTVDDPVIDGGAVEKLTYTLTYANTGGAAAESVELADTLPAGMDGCEFSSDGVTWSACDTATQHVFQLGAVAAGATGTLYVRGDSPDAPAPGSQLINTASIAGDAPTDLPVEDTAITQVGPPGGGSAGSPELSITKSADRTAIGAGEEVIYTLTVVNVGDGVSGQVNVADTIPATSYYSYQAGSISGGDARNVNGNDLSWTIDSLAVGVEVALSYRMVSSATGIPPGVNALDNIATLSDSDYCTDPSVEGCTSNEVTVAVSGNPRLTLSKSASPGSGLAPGDLVTWTLTLRNEGSATANNVLVNDPIADGLQFVSTSAPGSFDAVNNRALFNLADLASGAEETLSFVTRVGTLPAGDNQLLTNLATASAGNAASVQAQASVVAAAAPLLSLNKSGPGSIASPAAQLIEQADNATQVRVDSAALLEVGDHILIDGQIAAITGIVANQLSLDVAISAAVGEPVLGSASYALSYSNSGNATAENVILNDNLPAGWLYLGASPAPSSAPAVGQSGSVTWQLGDLPPGSSGTAQLHAIPLESGVNDALLMDDHFCTGVLPDDCVDTVETQVGGVTVHKRTDTPVVIAHPGGGVAQYRITLSNSLVDPVHNVSVTDLLPPGFSYRAGTAELDGVANEPTVDNGLPTWSAISLPGESSVELYFEADVHEDTGTATYDNELLVQVPVGIGLVPFDHLAVPDEDVTVVGEGAYLLQGYVFFDEPLLGQFDDDLGIPDVLVEINDDSGLGPYQVFTDNVGFFQRVLTADTWTVNIPEAANAAQLQGLNRYGSYVMPADTTLDAGNQVAVVYFGYVPDNLTTFTVSYHGNGHTEGTPPEDAIAYLESEPVTVLAQGDLARAGFTFVGWNTEPDGSGATYHPADSFAMPAADVDLWAQWASDPTYSVTYYGNGHTAGTAPVDANAYLEGATVTVQAQGDLTRDGFSFAGWSTVADGSGTAFSPADSFAMPAADVDLWAQWTPVLIDTGTLRGNVFLDVNGNAVKDSGEPNLVGIQVRVTDVDAAEHVVYTDNLGDYAVDVPVGMASIQVQGPADHDLTTANDQQSLNVVNDSVVLAESVGYQRQQTLPSGVVSGQVFLDNNSNGSVDPGEPDFAMVWVLITSSEGVLITVQTNLGGSFSVAVPPGMTQISVLGPDGYALTTANDDQTVMVPENGEVVAAPVGYVPGAALGNGELVGQVFLDANNNGQLDAGEAGLSGVQVQIEAHDGALFGTRTDASGAYAAVVAAGLAQIGVTDPQGLVLTTGNRDQSINAIDGEQSAATPVGYFDASAAPEVVPIPTLNLYGLLLLLMATLWLGLSAIGRPAARFHSGSTAASRVRRTSSDYS